MILKTITPKDFIEGKVFTKPGKKRPTELDRLTSAWKKATPSERKEFLKRFGII